MPVHVPVLSRDCNLATVSHRGCALRKLCKEHFVRAIRGSPCFFSWATWMWPKDWSTTVHTYRRIDVSSTYSCGVHPSLSTASLRVCNELLVRSNLPNSTSPGLPLFAAFRIWSDLWIKELKDSPVWLFHQDGNCAVLCDFRRPCGTFCKTKRKTI